MSMYFRSSWTSFRRLALILTSTSGALLATESAHAQLFFTNTVVGFWGDAAANWTNQSGTMLNPGTTAANWAGSNLVFNTAALTTNNVGAGASFGTVTWSASVTGRAATAANRYFFTGFTNVGNNTVLFAPKVTFSNESYAPVVYNEGQLTFSGVMTNLLASTALTFNNAAGATTIVSGVIGASAGGLVKDGAGTLLLSGANTYMGDTVINAGSLRLGNNSAIGGGALTINGGSLDVSGARVLVSNNLVNINGDFTYVGNNTLGLGTGTVTLNAAHTVIVTNTVTIGGVITGAGGLNVFDLNMTGPGIILATNAAAITLRSGGQTSTVNGTTAAPSTLQIAAPVSGPGGLDVFDIVKKGNGTLAFDAGMTLTADRTVSNILAGNLQINGAITDGGLGYGLTAASPAVLILSGTNTYTGVTRVLSNAFLRITSSDALGSTLGNTIVSFGGQLRVQGSVGVTNAENIVLSGASATTANFGAFVQQVNTGVSRFDGQITLDGGATIASFNAGASQITITKGIDGTGDLTLSATSANNGDTTFYLNGASTYTGNTYLKSFNNVNHWGVFQLGANNAFPTTTILNMQAAASQANFLKVRLNGYSQQLAGLISTNTTGTISTNIIVGGSLTPSVLTVSNAVDTTFDGNLGGPLADENNLALVKTGAGTLVLSSKNGGNTYTGGTTVNQGMLTAAHTGALPGYTSPGTISVAGGATLAVRVGGAGQWAAGDIDTLRANVSFANNTAMLGFDAASGSSSYGSAITESIGVAKFGANTLILNGASTYSGLTLVSSGTLVVAHAQALGSTAGITVVTNNAIVALSNGVDVAEDLIIGSATSGGALRSSSGSNTWSGRVTAGVGGSRIGADPGSTLRLAGGVLGNGTVMYLAPESTATVIVDSPVTNTGSSVNFLNGGTNYFNVGGHDWLQSTVYYKNVLVLGANDALPTGVRLTVGGTGAQTNGTLLMNGMSQTISRLESGTPDGNNDLIVNTAPTLSTLTVNQTISTIYGGLLNGNLALVKAGSATLSLTNGNSSFSGGATVMAGTLGLGGNGTAGTGPIDVRAGATLAIGSPFMLSAGQTVTNFGTVTGGLIIGGGARATGGGSYLDVTNASSGTLTPGAGGHTNYIASLTLMSGSTNSFHLTSTATHDMTIVTNSLNFADGRPLLRLDLTAWSGETSGYVVLYNNQVGVTAWDGSAQAFQLADWGTGLTSDGTVLADGLTVGVNGGTGSTNHVFAVHYNYEASTGLPGGNDIVLTVVPEPGTASMLALFGTVFLFRRFRRR